MMYGVKSTANQLDYLLDSNNTRSHVWFCVCYVDYHEKFGGLNV